MARRLPNLISFACEWTRFENIIYACMRFNNFERIDSLPARQNTQTKYHLYHSISLDRTPSVSLRHLGVTRPVYDYSCG